MTPLLKLSEVCARYSVSRQTVRAWVRSGRFPRAVRLPGGRPRWSLLALEHWEADGGAREKGRAA